MKKFSLELEDTEVAAIIVLVCIILIFTIVLISKPNVELTDAQKWHLLYEHCTQLFEDIGKCKVVFHE